MGRYVKAISTELTPKETRVYHVMRDYIINNGYAPSVRELGDLCGFHSSATVYHYINRLESKGFITKKDNSSRSLTLMKAEDKIVSIPIQNIFEDTDAEINDFVLISSSITKNTSDCFFIRANKNLDEINVKENDLLLINPKTKAVAGEMALIKEGKAVFIKTITEEITSIKQVGKIVYMLRSLE